MQPRWISAIQLIDIDAEKQIIKMKAIPNIYLMPIEMNILKEYLIIRENFSNSKGRKLLFIKRRRGGAYGEVPIDKTFIANCVKKIFWI